MKQTLTTYEELKLLASSDNANELTRRLARECLANREAQPVATVLFSPHGVNVSTIDAAIPDGTKLYTAPPAPAVPEEMKRAPDADVFDPGFMNGWNACRAAMLNHVGDTNEKAAEKCECSSIDYCENCLRAMPVQPVSSGYKLPDNVREALTLALQAMEFMGDTLNNIDAVCTEDVEYVTPAFNAVRELLAAAPEGGN